MKLKKQMQKVKKSTGKTDMKLKKQMQKIKKSTGKTDKIPSGIIGFDELAKGGFERESVNLVVGGSGSGKTIFAVQFLLEGIKKGENGLYVTFEEKKEDFYKNMLDFGYNLESLEKSGKFVFLEYSPETVKMMLDEGGGAIESIILKNKIKRMVIDSITSFSLLFDDELSKREAALSLFDIIRKWNCTSLLTLEKTLNLKENPDMSIEFEADSIILLYFVRIKGERKRFLEILKMRGAKHSTKVYPFEIDKGINVDKKAFIDKA